MIQIDRIEKEDWDKLSTDAHTAVFNEKRPSSWNRIDYALGIRSGLDIIGFATIRELDHESVYWQYGGGIPEFRNSPKMFKGYKAVADYCFENGVKNIQTLVENTNVVMLKMAMKIGFLIIGTKTLDGKTYVDLYLTKET